MTTTGKDGGPAFPHTVIAHDYRPGHLDEYRHEHEGMSKLLLLAKDAPSPQGEPTDEYHPECLHSSIEDRFRWAQAMLAREKEILEGE